MTERKTENEGLTAEEYTYHAERGQSLSEAVIHAVAEFTGRETIAINADGAQEPLDSLYDTIDFAALDSLFQPASDETSMVGTVEFCYCGCEVTVQSDGFVIVTNR